MCAHIAMETLNTQDLFRERNTCTHVTCLFLNLAFVTVNCTYYRTLHAVQYFYCILLIYRTAEQPLSLPAMFHLCCMEIVHDHFKVIGSVFVVL